MLSVRLGRRFGTHPTASAAVFSNSTRKTTSTDEIEKPSSLEEPALIKLKAERDPEKLFHLFRDNAHNRLVIENRFAFEDTVSRLAGAGRLDYIEHLLEHQKTLLQGRREGFVVRIIMLYGRAGMVKHAVDTFRDMHLYGCPRTVKSLNAALKVLTQTRDLEAIVSFVNDVPRKFDVKPDIVSVNIVVNAFCKMGIPDKSYIVLEEMEKVGIKPDVVTYTTLITAYYKSKQPEIANGLWNLMVMRGCLPNIATFNARVQFLVNRRRAWEANSLMGMMHRLGIVPDEVTYNLVIKGFCRAGYIGMAKRVFSALHEKGYKPNAKIYQTMIHYLCKDGELDLAYTMCKQSMEKNWSLSVESIYQLLQGLRMTAKISEARSIITLAQKRVPSFSAHQLGIMESILEKS